MGGARVRHLWISVLFLVVSIGQAVTCHRVALHVPPVCEVGPTESTLELAAVPDVLDLVHGLHHRLQLCYDQLSGEGLGVIGMTVRGPGGGRVCTFLSLSGHADRKKKNVDVVPPARRS